MNERMNGAAFIGISSWNDYSTSVIQICATTIILKDAK